MFVYGIRCPVTLLNSLPADTKADYYMEYGLLVFPAYTRPTYLQNHSHTMRPEFVSTCKRVIENNLSAVDVDLEHPYISENEDDTVRTIKQLLPGADTNWYHVPAVATKV